MVGWGAVPATPLPNTSPADYVAHWHWDVFSRPSSSSAAMYICFCNVFAAGVPADAIDTGGRALLGCHLGWAFLPKADDGDDFLFSCL